MRTTAARWFAVVRSGILVVRFGSAAEIRRPEQCGMHPCTMDSRVRPWRGSRRWELDGWQSAV